MDLLTMGKKLKYIVLSSLIGMSAYALTPFINAFGCNYKSQTSDNNLLYISTCKLGIVETIAWNKLTGEKKIFKGVLAKKNDNMFIFVFSSTLISKSKYDFYEGLNIRFSDPIIFSGKQIHTSKNDWVLVRNPSFQVYKVTTSGSLGFW